MNIAQQALDEGRFGGYNDGGRNVFVYKPNLLTGAEKAAAAVDVLEGIEAFRQSMPWYKRWRYCIGSALRDLRAVKEALL